MDVGFEDMHYEVEVNGRPRTVEVTRSGDGLAVAVDGRRRHVDVASLDAHTLSLLIGEIWPAGESRSGAHGRCASYEMAISQPFGSDGQLIVHVGALPLAVTLDGGRRRKAAGSPGGAAIGAPGALRIVAPMPGKVIRVLVAAGDAVKLRQPLVVVEAMKMENELRAGRDGRVTAIHVREGASVDAGTLLIELK
jgi:biotin carboxyl carrier protein